MPVRGNNNNNTPNTNVPLECPKTSYTHTHISIHTIYTLWHAWTITSTLDHLWISITAYLLRFRYHSITSMFWDKIIELESTVWLLLGVVTFNGAVVLLSVPHLTKEWPRKMHTSKWLWERRVRVWAFKAERERVNNKFWPSISISYCLFGDNMLFVRLSFNSIFNI